MGTPHPFILQKCVLPLGVIAMDSLQLVEKKLSKADVTELFIHSFTKQSNFKERF